LAGGWYYGLGFWTLGLAFVAWQKSIVFSVAEYGLVFVHSAVLCLVAMLMPLPLVRVSAIILILLACFFRVRLSFGGRYSWAQGILLLFAFSLRGDGKSGLCFQAFLLWHLLFL
jgi:hypothetical protein